MAVVLCALAGCAGPGPKLFPITPQTVRTLPDGRVERVYDLDGDAQADAGEILTPAGLIERLERDSNGDGVLDTNITPPAMATEDLPHLIIILDSVPFELVRDFWLQGRFRLFHPPARIVSPFPVMSDLCIADFFGVLPCNSVESQFYNGHALNSGFATYARETNSQWLEKVDYHLDFSVHTVGYLHPYEWFDHELRRIQEHLREAPHARFVAYVVGTSALGAQFGREGHVAGLIKVDRFCQQLVHMMHGRIHITLLSDHGHDFVASKRVDLRQALRRSGYRVGRTLTAPGDVIVPEFGIVTCAGIHTEEPATVARDSVNIEGVDLAAFQDESDRIVVRTRDGLARISRRDDRLRYRAIAGDPLRLKTILDELATRGLVDDDGFVADADLFTATNDHVYPDPIHRLWRAFHDMTRHTPDVLLSIKRGYHVGSAFISEVIKVKAAHGSLLAKSSSGFVMSTAGVIPSPIRMQNVRKTLRALNVPLDP